MAEKEMQKREASSPIETERTTARKVFIPRVDIREVGDAIVLLADMPGVDEKSIDITLEKNILTLAGRVEPEVYEGYRTAYAEYEAGDYERAFTLSDEIDRDRIEASVKNGVLKLTLPKAEPVKLRKISVKSA
ncbi:MAG TPA: Hsp20/alpha crystallin family protein [Syntrophales bacterium]|nr:Hsp20/alpha crystallin family protein [Syntrophales bacterium]HTZ39773.1 Hsp20/alpha crystallin family protein [Syntrophales bacterium]